MTGIVLVNPKYPHNVGHCVRAAACLDAEFVYWTGERVKFEGGKKGLRIPREERLRDYDSIDFKHVDSNGVFTFLEAVGYTPVAVEFDDRAERMPDFVHPERAVYVFGPEDGSLSRVHRMHCHRHVIIPTNHCVNLAAAVYITLYDRKVKAG